MKTHILTQNMKRCKFNVVHLRTVRKWIFSITKKVHVMESNKSQTDRSFQLMQSFWDMQKNIMRYIQKTATDNGLSVTQYNILMMLIHHKQVPQKAVQEKTYLPKSTLSQAINGLVESGYVARQQVEGNRREVELLISQKGKDLIKEIDQQKDGFHHLCQSAVDTLTDQQFQDLINIQKKIATNFEKQGSDHPCSKF